MRRPTLNPVVSFTCAVLFLAALAATMWLIPCGALAAKTPAQIVRGHGLVAPGLAALAAFIVVVLTMGDSLPEKLRGRAVWELEGSLAAVLLACVASAIAASMRLGAFWVAFGGYLGACIAGLIAARAWAVVLGTATGTWQALRGFWKSRTRRRPLLRTIGPPIGHSQLGGGPSRVRVGDFSLTVTSSEPEPREGGTGRET